MNKLLIYSLVVGLAGVVVVVGLVASGVFNHIIPTNENKTSPKTANALVVNPLEINVKRISVNKTNDNTAILRVVFDVHNPNQNTILLDGIHYNISSDKLPIISGNIGTETQLDVVRGQSAFPIIGDSTITLKDIGILHRNNIMNGTWDKVVDRKADYVIMGSYSTKQAANFDYSTGANEFNSTYP
jgi:hypothetical protein